MHGADRIARRTILLLPFALLGCQPSGAGGSTPGGSYALTVSKVGSGTVTSTPAGISCGATCSASYAAGTSVSLHAAAAGGYTFSGWAGTGLSCPGTADCTVTLSATTTVTATFASTGCGTCQVYETCGGAGFADQCGECTPESDAHFCTRQGKTCGKVTAADSCWVTRTVDCGTCSSGTCGGGGTPNVCGAASCTPEPDTAICARFGKTCGHLTAWNDCGQLKRGVSCGPACGCSDGGDNDGDGFTDWPDDPGCSGPDDTEAAVTGQIKDGWTAFKRSADTRVVYVSDSAGADGNDGLSAAHPKKTLEAGLALLRNGYPDWLLLKRGDTFRNQGLWVGKSGRSATEPLLVSSYGPLTGTNEDRPTLQGGNIDVSEGSHVAVAHLGVVLPVPNGDTPGFTINSATDVLVEGCRFQGGNLGGGFGNDDGRQGRLRLRRNVFYEPDGDGIYGHTDTYLIEENVIFHLLSLTNNGDRHGMYLARAGAKNATVRGNMLWLSQAENDGNGIMLRPGGIEQGNVVVGASWSGITSGGCNDTSGTPPCTGTNGPAVQDGNLVLDTPGAIAGLQYGADATLPGAQVVNNMVVRMWKADTYAVGITFGGDAGARFVDNVSVDAPVGGELGADNVWRDNLCYGTQGNVLMFTDGFSSGENLQASGNRYYPWVTGGSTVSFSEWLTISKESASSGDAFSLGDTTRCSLGAYNAALGGANDTRAFFQYAAEHHGKFSYDALHDARAALAFMRDCLKVKP